MAEGEPERHPSGESLRDIDEILEHRSERERELAAEEQDRLAARERFLADFDETLRGVIRPTMESIIRRLRADGGDGLVWEGESGVLHAPRVILWMSLEGKIGQPRQDLNPYLQLDVDLPRRRLDVWEGDMWQKEGTSRPGTPLSLDDISADTVTARVVGILRRAAEHGMAM